MVWALARKQHGVVARRQLRGLGFSEDAIDHRIATGRLHPLHEGVYAVGRPEVTHYGRWMAAVLASGEGAVLSHESAAALWGIRPRRRGRIEVSVPAERTVNRPGIRPHRRKLSDNHVTKRHGIPVTTPLLTLIDLDTSLATEPLEAAVNEADNIARRAGLPKPETRTWINGFQVDFYWPDLGLVVETDGLRQNPRPGPHRRRPHPAPIHPRQVRFDPEHVQATLAQVRANLRSARGGEQHGPSSR